MFALHFLRRPGEEMKVWRHTGKIVEKKKDYIFTQKFRLSSEIFQKQMKISELEKLKVR